MENEIKTILELIKERQIKILNLLDIEGVRIDADTKNQVEILANQTITDVGLSLTYRDTDQVSQEEAERRFWSGLAEARRKALCENV